MGAKVNFLILDDGRIELSVDGALRFSQASPISVALFSAVGNVDGLQLITPDGPPEQHRPDGPVHAHVVDQVQHRH